MKLEFIIYFGGEPAAGLNSFSDSVTIITDGIEEEPDFTEHIRSALLEWYDGASVETKHEYDERMEAENKLWDCIK